ncbi:hypothetical protein [Pseudoduganella ginsengisoli]|uniref:Uncharacterized protein n=1 Tax=Pseudoduganella ginsengisoli TaxID=1462440 RepID=A0A6L6Q9F3_9BURK|nr:hypothetical protein [Pseudoduganella ginsengisoli]MTW05831.1 hypothetical protein [Pseudoduganella ginsengisoli]
MHTPTPPSSDAAAADAARFRRRLYILGAIALAGLAALTARLVWLQAF